jgi:hypothetical protein
MRPDDNFESAPDFKLAAILEVLEEDFLDPVIIVFEDRDDVVTALKSKLKCVICQVNIGGRNAEEKAADGNHNKSQTTDNAD